jgi:hypothetical protein
VCNTAQEIGDECAVQGSAKAVTPNSSVRMDLVEIIRVELRSKWSNEMDNEMQFAHEILHGFLAGLVDAFHELEHIVGESINNGNTNVVIIFILREIVIKDSREKEQNEPSTSSHESQRNLLRECSGNRTWST